MIDYHCKVLSCQVVSEQLYRHHYHQQLLIAGVLGVAEGFGGVCDYLFDNSSSFILFLPFPTSLASVVRTKRPS